MLANGRSHPTVIARDKRGSGGSWGCVLLTNWLIAAETGSRRAAESGCHQKKGPSVFRCLPHFPENRDDEGPALRARMFYAQQLPHIEGRKAYADKSTSSYEPCH